MNLIDEIISKAKVNKLGSTELKLVYKYESLKDKTYKKIFSSYLIIYILLILKFNYLILITVNVYIIYLLLRIYLDKKILIKKIKALSSRI